MKIVQINAVYGVGSTGKTTKELHKKLIEQGHESFVFWSTKCSSNEEGLYRIHSFFGSKLHAVLSRLLLLQGFCSYFSTKKAIKELSHICPDVVHLRNIHSNFLHLPLLLKYLKKERIPVVITLHDCWFFTGGCFHFILKNCDGYTKNCENCPYCKGVIHKSIRKHIFSKKKKMYKDLASVDVVGVSKWVSDSSKKSALFGDNVSHTYIYNWIDLGVFQPSQNKGDVFEKYSIAPNTKIILGVAQSWKADKGLEIFEHLSQKIDNNTKIILVGSAQGMQSTDKIKFIGRTENVKELIDLYSAADVFVNPSPAETFGKVTVEALACGCRVVAFNNTGTAELVPDFCGALVEDKNEDEMIKSVLELLYKEDLTYDKRLDFVKENFDFSKQCEKYIELYKSISIK